MKTRTNARWRKALAVLTVMLLALASFALPSFATDGYEVSFVFVGGSGSVIVYNTQDTSDVDGDAVHYARNSETGEIDLSGDGQINYTVVPASGCSIASTEISGTYKNLKTVDADANLYRITKIGSSLTVTITLSEEAYADPTVTFTDAAATVSAGSGKNLSIDGTSVTVTAAGTYTFTGSCSNGSITVGKNVTGVTLILDNLNLTASATAAITCNKGSGVTILAAAGSVNNLADDKFNNDDVYTDTTLYPNIENAVIKTKSGSNVTIDGTGTINVTANGKSGVKASADQGDGTVPVFDSSSSLTIQNVTLNITNNVADTDGIKAEATLNILSGNVTVNGKDDAIKSDFYLNIGAEGTDGPTIRINAATEGMEATVINVYSGNVFVNASNDGINAANSDIAERSTQFSYNQYGGYVYINCTGGDALDSNGGAVLAGGVLEAFGPSQGDGDPLDTEYGCTFSGATVLGVGNNMMQQSCSGTYVTFGGSAGGMGGGMGGRYAPGMGGSSGATVIAANAALVIKDSSGNTLYTSAATAPRAAGYVVFASPALSANGSYTLSASGASSTSTSGTATTGTSAGTGGNPGGTPGGNPFSGTGTSTGTGGSASTTGGSFFSFFSDFIQKIVDFFTSLFSFRIG